MTTKSAHELRDDIAELYEKLEDLADGAKRAGRKSLTRAEEAEGDKIESEIFRLKGKLKEREAYERALAQRAGEGEGRDYRDRHNQRGGNFSHTFGEAALTVARSGRTISVSMDPEQVFKRAVMTSDSGSAGQSLVKSTSSQFHIQATENVGFLEELNYMGTPNNATYPYLDRDDRLTAQNKTETGALDEQAYVISSKTVDLKNYYTYPVLHNNVLRDSALGMGGMENFIYTVAANDVRRQVANDVINGDGQSNNMTGIVNMSGKLTLDWGGASVTDFTMLTSTAKSLMDKNVNTANLSVIMPPALWEIFSELEDTTGQPLAMPEWLRDLNIKFFVSQFMADNQLVIGDLSKLDLFFWENVEMGLATANETLFSKDQVAIRCLWRGDLISREADHILLVDNIVSNT